MKKLEELTQEIYNIQDMMDLLDCNKCITGVYQRLQSQTCKKYTLSHKQFDDLFIQTKRVGYAVK